MTSFCFICCEAMSTTSEWEILGDAKFRWGTKRGTGGKNKEFQFYGSFSYDGVEYKLHDYVYMYTERQSYPYVGKLIKSWQNPNQSKRVKVQWLFLPSEIRYWLKHHNVNVREKEIFFASGEGKGLVNVCPLVSIGSIVYLVPPIVWVCVSPLLFKCLICVLVVNICLNEADFDQNILF